MASDRRMVAVVGCMTALLAACPSDQDGPLDPDAGALALDASEGLDESGDAPEQPREEPSAVPSAPAADGGSKPGVNPVLPTSPAEPAMNQADGNGGESPTDPVLPSEASAEAASAPADGRFFLPPESRNSASPRIAIDQHGGVHSAYPAAAGSGAFYSYCPNDCADPSQMSFVELPTDAIPGSALIAVTPDGRPRVVIPTYLHVYYAECDSECTDAANWTMSMLIDHQAAEDVTGDALALDSQGRPRFLMHTYVAYLGVGQKEPHTYYAQCDAGCADPSNWSISSIQDQMWTYSTLLFDANDVAHLSTVAIDPNSSVKKVAYLRCESDCALADSWSGIYLADAFENAVASLVPSVSLALTQASGPRVVALVMPESGARALMYFECDQNCVDNNWSYTFLSDKYELGSGVDIALDANDHPRLVYTLDYNIGLYHCGEVNCATETTTWNLEKVEFASDLATDTAIFWPNCSYATWQLHDPRLVLTADGSARVGYEASDISGGFPTMDPSMTPCSAGKDMTMARMALMPAF